MTIPSNLVTTVAATIVTRLCVGTVLFTNFRGFCAFVFVYSSLNKIACNYFNKNILQDLII